MKRSKKVKIVISKIRFLGTKKTILLGLDTVFGSRHTLRSFAANKCGLEIGGPSKLFFSRNILSLYPFVKSLDNVNFSLVNLWSRVSFNTDEFHYGNRVGKQLIMEASSLNIIPDEKYDFVASCHVIELDLLYDPRFL